jgi:hypothetical protein
MDHAFACTINCSILSTNSRRVKVARGGYLDTSAIINFMSSVIQGATFSSDFKLLELKGHDIILGCDWIKQHSPIALDLRDTSRNLIIQNDGITEVIFIDFTAPPAKPITSASKLEKFCKIDIMGYVIQVNAL